MHTHAHKNWHHSLKEHRLCHRELGPDHAYESIEGANKLNRNAALNNIDKFLFQSNLKDDHVELTGDRPFDRAYIFALMAGNAIDPAKHGGELDYDKVGRDDVDLIRAMGFEGLSANDLGKRLLRFADHKALTKLSKTRNANELGSRLPTKLVHIQRKMMSGGEMTRDERELMGILISYYRGIRTQLDERLLQIGIQIPGIQGDVQSIGSKNLTRQEYLGLLSLMWNGEIDTPDLTGSVQDVRILLGNRSKTSTGAPDPQLMHIQQLYTDRGFKELGPQEVLSSMGMRIGPHLHNAYMRLVEGKNARFGSEQREDPGIPGLTPLQKEKPMTIEDVGGASSWIMKVQTPDGAKKVHTFLRRYMTAPSGSANDRFLRSLKAHYIDQINPAGTKALNVLTGGVGATGMGTADILDKNDTDAVLGYVTQSLMDSERVMKSSADQKREMRDRFDAMKGWVELLKGKHGMVGAIAGWGATYMFGRMLWGIITSEKNRYGKLALFAAATGVAIHQMRRSERGESGIGRLLEGLTNWSGKEKLKKPEEQTIPNYWFNELDFSTSQERAALSVIQEANVQDSIEFYEGMKKEMATSKNGRFGTPLPSGMRADTKLKNTEMGKITRNKEKVLYFTVLEKFFANRGKEIAKNEIIAPLVRRGTSITNTADLGLEYIKMRYGNHGFLEKIRGNKVRIGCEEIDAALIVDNEAYAELLQKFNHCPDFIRDLQTLRYLLLEQSGQSTVNWQMSMVFLLEANPEILRRMGDEGKHASSQIYQIWESLHDSVRDVTGGYKEFIEPTPEVAERLRLIKDENGAGTLLEQLKDETFKDIPNTPANKPELDELYKRLFADIDAFAKRLPATQEAEKEIARALKKFVNEDWGTKDYREILRDIEKQKYRLLIVSAKAEHEIGISDIPASTARLTEDDWIDFITDRVCSYTFRFQSSMILQMSMISSTKKSHRKVGEA